ncbi:MAG: class I SAM-dependent methyltransferase [Candidatus Thermoplasmatota archaeon]
MDNQFNEQTYSKEMPTIRVEETRIKFILDGIPDAGLKILDLGCWDGSYAQRYKKTTNMVYGIESSVSSARRAETKGIIVQQGDYMEKEFFAGEKFDIVVAGEIIEHVFDTDVFLEKIKNNLKSKGRIIITTPNVASLPRRMLMLMGVNPLLENRNIPKVSVGHIRYFTFSDMYTLLKDHNCTIIRSASDVLNLNNTGTLFDTHIPKLFKTLGKTILIEAESN